MSDSILQHDPSAEPDLTGLRIGDYCLLRRLGQGGMAEVYLAEQASLRRPVAFKVLRRSLAGDDTYIRRFVGEAQAAARLVHANIVQIYEVGVRDGVRFMAQEYVAGQNLKEYLTRHGRGLPAALVLYILRQTAAALVKAAQANITHRDIKPENIMLSRTGEVKVADFGLARVDGEALALTQVGLTMGTPLYMSPEQVEGRNVDPRSDLYSLGVTGYHMLANRPPFEGDTALAVAVQHLKHEPPSLAELRPDVQREFPALITVIQRLMAKKADDRPVSATELLRDLRAMAPDNGEDIPWDEAVLASPPAETARPISVTAATQQLQVLLKAEAVEQKKSIGLAPIVAVVGAVFVAVALGAGSAYVFRPPPLLQFDPAAVPSVEKFDTAEQQWAYASIATKNVEQSWKAVEQYFPANKSPLNQRYARAAKVGLANFYRSERKSESALALYEELARIDDETGAEFRWAGIAGKALVLDQLQRAEEAAETLKSVIPRRSQITDESLRSGVERLAGKYKLDMP